MNKSTKLNERTKTKRQQTKKLKQTNWLKTEVRVLLRPFIFCFWTQIKYEKCIFFFNGSNNNE